MEKYFFVQTGKSCQITDNINGVKIVWQVGKFNDTQEAEVLDGGKMAGSTSAGELAKVCREIGEYLNRHHPDTI